jgi:hypothetical protein
MFIAEIVSQHAEEAAFLWLLRSKAIRAPHYALNDLAKLDDRVEAHVDGLRAAATWWDCGCEIRSQVVQRRVEGCAIRSGSRVEAL